ncbi:MAG TPA: hypothetical protein DCS93_19100 [Microscillaceae bacterium]|nr:hypothetical protein [Microscillaceae bacterium]
MLYGHGDDAYLQSNAIVANFSTNVYDAPEPQGLKEHLWQNWEVVNHYPEVLAESLRVKIAQYHQVPEDQVLVLNGAEEGIHLVARMQPQQTATICIPTFAEYADACQMYGHQLTFVPWQQLPAWEFDTSLAFICNPNNPTGEAVKVELIEHLLKSFPKTLFCVDEAFIDFTLAIDSHIPLLAKYDNLMVLKSLTKNFSIPGLRLGYLLASPQVIQQMQAMKVAWSVNALAIEAGKYLFDHCVHQQVLPIEAMLQERAQWQDALRTISGFEWCASDTHFFLGKVIDHSAAELKAYLVNYHQILIRDAANFQGLTPHYFRVASLSPQKNQLLTRALQAWSAKSDK